MAMDRTYILFYVSYLSLLLEPHSNLKNGKFEIDMDGSVTDTSSFKYNCIKLDCIVCIICIINITVI